MANNMLPSWVQQPQSQTNSANGTAVQPYTNVAGASTPMAQAAPTPAQQQKNPNAWDGIGPNTNQNQTPAPVSNFGSPVTGANVGNLNLPQNIQQILQMFQQMNGSGFQGLQPVNGNPFGSVNNGANLSSWGTASGPGGIYGGT